MRKVVAAKTTPGTNRKRIPGEGNGGRDLFKGGQSSPKNESHRSQKGSPKVTEATTAYRQQRILLPKPGATPPAVVDQRQLIVKKLRLAIGEKLIPKEYDIQVDIYKWQGYLSCCGYYVDDTELLSLPLPHTFEKILELVAKKDELRDQFVRQYREIASVALPDEREVRMPKMDDKVSFSTWGITFKVFTQFSAKTYGLYNKDRALFSTILDFTICQQKLREDTRRFLHPVNDDITSMGMPEVTAAGDAMGMDVSVDGCRARDKSKQDFMFHLQQIGRDDCDLYERYSHLLLSENLSEAKQLDFIIFCQMKKAQIKNLLLRFGVSCNTSDLERDLALFLLHDGGVKINWYKGKKLAPKLSFNELLIFIITQENDRELLKSANYSPYISNTADKFTKASWREKLTTGDPAIIINEYLFGGLADELTDDEIVDFLEYQAQIRREMKQSVGILASDSSTVRLPPMADGSLMVSNIFATSNAERKMLPLVEAEGKIKEVLGDKLNENSQQELGKRLSDTNALNVINLVDFLVGATSKPNQHDYRSPDGYIKSMGGDGNSITIISLPPTKVTKFLDFIEVKFADHELYRKLLGEMISIFDSSGREYSFSEKNVLLVENPAIEPSKIVNIEYIEQSLDFKKCLEIFCTKLRDGKISVFGEFDREQLKDYIKRITALLCDRVRSTCLEFSKAIKEEAVNVLVNMIEDLQLVLTMFHQAFSVDPAAIKFLYADLPSDDKDLVSRAALSHKETQLFCNDILEIIKDASTHFCQSLVLMNISHTEFREITFLARLYEVELSRMLGNKYLKIRGIPKLIEVVQNYVDGFGSQVVELEKARAYDLLNPQNVQSQVTISNREKEKLPHFFQKFLQPNIKLSPADSLILNDEKQKEAVIRSLCLLELNAANIDEFYDGIKWLILIISSVKDSIPSTIEQLLEFKLNCVYNFMRLFVNDPDKIKEDVKQKIYEKLNELRTLIKRLFATEDPANTSTNTSVSAFLAMLNHSFYVHKYQLHK